jgi:hypothetical protein
MGKNRRRTATIWVPVGEIQISERSRRTISQSTVERYRRWLEQGLDPPPVRLARHGDAYLVRDGRHRIAAALAAGDTFVEAELQRIVGWLGRRLARRSSSSPAATQPLWGRSSVGRATRLHRGGVGSTPAVSTESRRPGPESCEFGVAASLWRWITTGRKEAERGFESRPVHSINASVVSTASTRPLYGRGAGSTPAGGSLRS